MKPSTFRSLVLLLGLALGAPGCAYFAPTPTLLPQEQAVWINKDLPVPEGFALDENATLRHERSSYRRLHLVYRRMEYLGQQRVAEFVRQQFAATGWSVQFVYGLDQRKLLLHRGAEECRVEVKEDFGDCFTEVTIDVEPRHTPDGSLVASAPRDGAGTIDIPVPPPAPSRDEARDEGIAAETSASGG